MEPKKKLWHIPDTIETELELLQDPQLSGSHTLFRKIQTMVVNPNAIARTP
jgi:hypothetical protein